jgi:cephalosporin hydroxylase
VATEISAFEEERRRAIESQSEDRDVHELGLRFLCETAKYKYSYNFDWLGRPIIQFPQDMVAVQEIIWAVRPDLIIETGIAHGGSLIYSASILAMLDYADAAMKGHVIDPAKPKRRVLGIDIEIRKHNRIAIEQHPFASRIELLEGSSIDDRVTSYVKSRANTAETVMVFLDSNHTCEHVLKELEAYAPLVTRGSYCVVFDTVIEDMPSDMFPDRPWGVGDNPKTAVIAYLEKHLEFEVDSRIDNKLLISVAPNGYLRRIY